MKKYVVLSVLASVTLVLLAGCAKEVDKKLDKKYDAVRFEVEVQINEVDSLTGKMQFMRAEHDKQDVKINKQGLSPEDKAMQEKHITWFNNYEPTLTEMDEWVETSQGMIADHKKLEATHDKAEARQIRADHQGMLADIKTIKADAEEYLEEFIQADSVVHTFFADHAYLNKKYKVPSEHGVKPPTSK